jgi:hypothetical protein
MSIRTTFYDDDITTYYASDFCIPWSSLISNGIFGSTSFQVSADSPTALDVVIAAGSAMCNGFYAVGTSSKVAIIANTSGLNRIDLVVINFDAANFATTIEVVQGTPSAKPAAPSYASNQIPLAQVKVINNLSVITNSVITNVAPAATVAIDGTSPADKLYSYKYFGGAL